MVFEIDKDLLSFGKVKEYGPDTCLFVPPRINGFIAYIYSNNTSGSTGVHFYKSRKKWRAQLGVGGENKFLGDFDTKEEATRVYRGAKIAEAHRLIELYKDDLPKPARKNIIRIVKHV